MIGKETRISTYQFNTTDGKSHTVNVSDYNATHPVVMDIDSISIAYPDPTQINFIANPYLDTTGGMYSMNLTAYVYDASGNPVVDGTVVNFNINEPDVIFNGGTPTNSPYNPFISGSLNGNNSQYVSISTGSGKAVVRYGWFPDNRIPSGFVKITAMINNTPSVNSTLYLIFNGTTQVWWTIVPTMRP